MATARNLQPWASRSQPALVVSKTKLTGSGEWERPKFPRKTGKIGQLGKNPADGDFEAACTLGERILNKYRPPKELIEYYKRKIATFHQENDALLGKLEKYKAIADRSIDLERDLRSANEELGEIKKALSDMQVYLFQEREQVLRLYAENDRLKIREVDDRKKIEVLLSLCNTTELELTYFLKDSKYPLVVPQLNTSNRKMNKKETDAQQEKKNRHPPVEDVGTLYLQIESLQAQLEEQARLSNDQVQTLMEDRRLQMEEREADCKLLSTQLKQSTDQLQQTQDLLYEATRDFLQLRTQYQAGERNWMNQKNMLLQEVQELRDQYKKFSEPLVTLGKPDEIFLSNEPAEKRSQLPKEMQQIKDRLQREIDCLKQEVFDKNHAVEVYQDQYMKSEEEKARVLEKATGERKLFKEQVVKLNSHVDKMKIRYNQLEDRRRMEAEGFRTDVRFLRNRIHELERQLYYAATGIRVNKGKDGKPVDLAVLMTMQHAANSVLNTQKEIRQVKTKVYELENTLRNM